MRKSNAPAPKRDRLTPDDGPFFENAPLPDDAPAPGGNAWLRVPGLRELGECRPGYRATRGFTALILALFVFSWLLLITFEPDTMWTRGSVAVELGEDEAILTSIQMTNNLEEKLLDSASAVAATLNNIGPGLGVVGAESNYAGFSQGAKLLFVWLMMLGRVEIFSVLVLFFPTFWRRV